MRPCKDEAQKIISYLLESYEKGLKKNANRTVTSDPNSNQVAAKFKNLQKELGLVKAFLRNTMLWLMLLILVNYVENSFSGRSPYHKGNRAVEYTLLHVLRLSDNRTLRLAS